MGDFGYMSVIRDMVRDREEIFKSDYVTFAEICVYGSLENIYKEQEKFREQKEKIHNRLEILDL